MAAKLKNFNRMWDAYPAPGGSADEAKKMIGGRVDSDGIKNTCVVRLSRAFNYSGNPVPETSRDEILTVRGADGLPYALRVKEWTRYMRRKYGEPDVEHEYESEDGGGDVPPQFEGCQGVVIFDVEGWNDATGHVDLWDGEACRHNCYFNRAAKVMLWKVDDEPDGAYIDESVGAGGKNNERDVIVVQQLLLHRGFDPGPIDGVVGRKTIAAIKELQSGFLSRPDGRVDPDGRTFQELLGS